MGLREDRVLFTNLIARLLVEISERDWKYGEVEVAVDEWTVHSERVYIDRLTGERRTGTDRVHHPKGLHPRGLAVDVNVYINGEYISAGGHPIWTDIDEMAHRLHPKLSNGSEFNDSNHISLGEI